MHTINSVRNRKSGSNQLITIDFDNSREKQGLGTRKSILRISVQERNSSLTLNFKICVLNPTHYLCIGSSNINIMLQITNNMMKSRENRR